MSVTNQTLTAYHEAAHGLLAFLNKVRIVKISIVPNELAGSLGYLISSNKLIDPGATTSINRDRLEHFIMITLAGGAAEKIYDSSCNMSGSAVDFQIADQLLKDLTHSPKEKELLKELLVARTTCLLKQKENWAMVDALACHLLNSEPTVKGRNVLKIFKQANPQLEREAICGLRESLNALESGE